MILGWRRGSGKELVSLEKTPVTPGPVRAAIARVADRPYPTLHSLRVNTVWTVVRVLRVLPRSPKLVVLELRPISIGMWRVVKFWAVWVSAAQYREFANQSEGNTRAKHGASLERARTARMVVTVILLLAAIIYGFNIVDDQPEILYAAAVVLVAVFDAVGRHNRVEPERMPPPPMPSVLTGNVPLSQITKSILEAFTREGFEEGSVGVARYLEWEPHRMEYRVQLSLRDALEAKHLRAVERAIGAKDYSVRNLATDSSTVRELVIRVGDPLAVPVERPFYPTGSRSIVEGIDMGVSAGDVPFILPAAGVHTRMVTATGGGKTTWFLRARIDGLSACRDCVIGGIDITNGPEFPLWRGVIQHRGYDPETAAAVLQGALDEIARRAKILTAIAEDDDPTNDTTEWHTGLGPAYVILIDEFAQLAAYNGKGEYKDDPNLLAPALQIMRTGRKHWVSIDAYTQRTGNDDFGSTTMSTQCGVSIAGPCSPDDSRVMFGLERRDAGFTPHMLSPGVEGDIRDAGKVMITSPMHRAPDLYRVYAPGSAGEVKRRARQRLDDGLPTLNAPAPDHDTVDAVEVPEALAAVEEAFTLAGMPEFMATAELLARTGYTQPELTTGLRGPDGRQLVAAAQQRKRLAPGQNPARGYLLADVEKAIRDL